MKTRGASGVMYLNGIRVRDAKVGYPIHHDVDGSLPLLAQHGLEDGGLGPRLGGTIALHGFPFPVLGLGCRRHGLRRGDRCRG